MMKNKLIKIYLLFGVILFNLLSFGCKKNFNYYLKQIDIEIVYSQAEENLDFYKPDYQIFESFNEIKEYFNNDRFKNSEDIIYNFTKLEQNSFFESNIIVFFGGVIGTSDSVKVNIIEENNELNIIFEICTFKSSVGYITEGLKINTQFYSLDKKITNKYKKTTCSLIRTEEIIS